MKSPSKTPPVRVFVSQIGSMVVAFKGCEGMRLGATASIAETALSLGYVKASMAPRSQPMDVMAVARKLVCAINA